MRRDIMVETHNENDAGDDEEERTLFCANLDERVTDELLYEVFLQAGPVESVRIPKDQSGKQRTFGFVIYAHKSTVPYALQLYHGLSLYRKTLTIKFQGGTLLSQLANHYSPGRSDKRSSYDNSSLRGGNCSTHGENPLQNPFRNSYSPDYHAHSGTHDDNISKHASSQKRRHNNVSPYQRKSGNKDGGNYDRDRDYNKRRHYNNLSDRRPDQRSGGKNRR